MRGPQTLDVRRGEHVVRLNAFECPGFAGGRRVAPSLASGAAALVVVHDRALCDVVMLCPWKMLCTREWDFARHTHLRVQYLLVATPCQRQLTPG